METSFRFRHFIVTIIPRKSDNDSSGGKINGITLGRDGVADMTEREKWARLALVVAVASLLFGAIALVAARADLSAGLAMRGGSVAVYKSRGIGPSLSSMRSGDEIWGFIEWPERGFYGFFDGKRERDGEFYAGIRAPGIAARLILSSPSLFRRDTVRLEGPSGLGGVFSLERVTSPGLRVDTFAGMLDRGARSLSPLSRLFASLSPTDGANDPGVSVFHVDLLDGAKAGRPASMDVALRKTFDRGRGARAYALDEWRSFREGRVLPEGPKAWPGSLIERQYGIAQLPSAFSLASERYVFDGGAHGNTVMVAASFDAATGDVLELGDLFVEGSESALGDRITAEALRLLAPPGGRLTGAGFFEDRIAPSADFFVCRSGVAFHYNRYALAPYAFGDYTFVVPWAELGGLLKDPSRWAALGGAQDEARGKR